MTEQKKSLLKNPAAELRYETNIGRMCGEAGTLAQEIWKLYKRIDAQSSIFFWEGSHTFTKLSDAYAGLCGIRPEKINDFGEFWNPRFEDAIINIFGGEEAKLLREYCALVYESPYAHTIYRPSYRTRIAGYYIYSFYIAIIYSINFNCFDLGLAEMMRQNHTEISGFDCRLALALRGGDMAATELTRDAILGVNRDIKLTNPIVRGVVKSGVPAQLEQLGRLLIASRGQEWIRQAILENANSGSVKSHAYFIGLVIENKLTRLSTAVRTFSTWTGLAYENVRPAVIEKCVRLAYKYLNGETAYAEGLQSADSLEVFMALWSGASRDISISKTDAQRLLDVPEKHRRLVGWYFLKSTVYPKIIHDIAMEHIDVRESEELAWICRCLYKNNGLMYLSSMTDFDIEAPRPDSSLPDGAGQRKSQFDSLCSILDFIGNSKTMFSGSIFPWSNVRLDSRDAAKCMLGLIIYDRDPEMILRFAGYLPVMDTEIRTVYYTTILNPAIPAQRELLLAGLSDKSVSVKDNIIKQLAKETLSPRDIEFLANTLIASGPVSRNAAAPVMEKQPDALILQDVRARINTADDEQLLA